MTGPACDGGENEPKSTLDATTIITTHFFLTIWGLHAVAVDCYFPSDASYWPLKCDQPSVN